MAGRTQRPRATAASGVIGRALQIAALAAWCAGCIDNDAGDDGAMGALTVPPWALACPDAPAALRLEHVQMLGTQRSYHVASAMPHSKRWASTHAPLDVQLEQQGVRAFELDLHVDEDGVTFHVANLPGIDDGTTCETLESCLLTMWAWSQQNPCAHTLVLLLGGGDGLDARQIADHLGALEAAILRVWPRERLLTPDQVRGGTVCVDLAVRARGWPWIEATRGRLLVALKATGDVGSRYRALHPHLHGALAFVTGKVGETDVAIVGDPGLTPEAAREAVAAGYLVAIYPSATATSSQAALASGAQLVMTDAPVARARYGGFALTLPGGQPSRCGPEGAPTACTTAAVNGLPEPLAP